MNYAKCYRLNGAPAVSQASGLETEYDKDVMYLEIKSGVMRLLSPSGTDHTNNYDIYVGKI